METIYALWRGVGVLCETLLLTYLLWKKLPPAHNRRSRMVLGTVGLAAALFLAGSSGAPNWLPSAARLLLYPLFALVCFGGVRSARGFWGLGMALLTLCCGEVCALVLRAAPTFEQAEGLNRSLFRFAGATLPLPVCAVLTVLLARTPRGFGRLPGRAEAARLGGVARIRAGAALTVFCGLILAGFQTVGLGADRARLEEAEAEAAALRREKQYNDDLIRISDSVRQIKHDYANHMNVIAALTQDGDLEKLRQYMADYHAEYGAVEHYAATGEPFVDALLASKLMACEARRVPVRIVAFGWGRTELTEVELVSLFGNLIDNAVNACAVLPEPKRQIKLIFKRKAGMLSLCVSNTTNGLVPESALHGGLGLPRIRSIVAVHKGIFNLRRENGLFTVEILLPVLEEEA